LSLKELVCLWADSRDNDAWEEFDSRVRRPIGLTIMRTASLWDERSRSLVEDLVQETYTKLLKDRCRHLRDFAIQHCDDAIITGYIIKTAINVTHDYFRKLNRQKSGGGQPHVSLSHIDPVAPSVDPDFEVLLKEIDELLKRCLTGPDRERDRLIFRLYFRLGMSCEEVAFLRTIGLSSKGVGSVIERLKRCIREQILGSGSDSEDDEE